MNRNRATRRAAVSAAAVCLAAAPAFAATTTVIGTGKVSRGTVVVSKSGLTLYGFTSDRGSSSCNGGCASTWVPWIANGSVTVKAGSGLNQKLVGTIRRSNGRKQITYGGHPLYHFIGDTQAGQQNGEGKQLNGGYWYVISKQGKFLKPSSGLIGGY